MQRTVYGLKVQLFPCKIYMESKITLLIIILKAMYNDFPCMILQVESYNFLQYYVERLSRNFKVKILVLGKLGKMSPATLS